MRFELIVLGTSAATPAHGRFCSAQLLCTDRTNILVDCGEGTQLRIQQSKEGYSKLKVILISHLHGDHYFGLPGLITSLLLNGREAPLTIISPPGLEERLGSLLDFETYPSTFPINFIEIAATEPLEVWADQSLRIKAFPLQHRLVTNGYLIEEQKRADNLVAAAITTYQIPVKALAKIKEGEDFITSAGELIPHDELVKPAAKPRSYAYCSDTRYHPELAQFVAGVDLLYHEATFLHQELEKAQKTQHSTALEAGWTARDAEVGTLILGHFSARYYAIQQLEDEARTVFANAFAGRDLARFTVPFQGRS